MKKISLVLFIVSLVLAVAFIFPRLGTSNLLVDDSGCLGCHDAAYPNGVLHSQSAHSNCDSCHAEMGDTPSSSKCITCHPLGNTGKCELVLSHENSTEYNPSGASCINCHGDCDGGETTTTTTVDGETTTTTTVPQTTIAGNRYEVFLVGPFEGCSATTLTFRSDNILTLECMDGFGTYLAFGNIFTAFYWSNNYYQGYSLGLILSGIALDPYIIGGGIAYFGSNVSPVVLTGYILSTP